jgi:hypothetical protein
VILCPHALHHRRCTLRHPSSSDLCSTSNKENLLAEDLLLMGEAMVTRIWCFACLCNSCERNIEKVLWLLEAVIQANCYLDGRCITDEILSIYPLFIQIAKLNPG